MPWALLLTATVGRLPPSMPWLPSTAVVWPLPGGEYASSSCEVAELNIEEAGWLVATSTAAAAAAVAMAVVEEEAAPKLLLPPPLATPVHQR